MPIRFNPNRANRPADPGRANEPINRQPARRDVLDAAQGTLSRAPQRLPLSAGRLQQAFPRTAVIGLGGWLAPHTRGLVNLRLDEFFGRDTGELDFSRLGISSLPPRFPPGISRLNLAENFLSELREERPWNLPQSVSELNIGRNGLTRLPSSLPPGLGHLKADRNLLNALPDNLPPNLQTLSVRNNLLTILPNTLPPSLERLEADGNLLSTLPRNLPARLQVLSIRNNRLSDISRETINCLGQLDPTATVDLRGNDLSNQTIDDLIQLQSSPGYRGPPIMCTPCIAERIRVARPRAAEAAEAAEIAEAVRLADSAEVAPAGSRAPAPAPARARARARAHELAPGMMQADERMQELTQALARAQAEVQVRVGARERALARDAMARATPANTTRATPTFNEALAGWMPPPQARIAATSAPWTRFAREPGTAAFAQFLDRLRNTVNVHDRQLQSSVVTLLSRLEVDPQLRREVFVLSEGATATCEDRVSHTFNAMRQLHLASDVARGNYDQRLPQLLEVARGMFRLDQLEIIARAHAAARPGVDQIEVFLAYQVMLRQRLALPLDTAEMRYPSSSQVNWLHVIQAQRRVRQAERRDFANYLSSDWQPWQSVLQRLAPELNARAKEELIEAMGDEFSTRLEARLSPMGLQNDADSQRIVGPQVQAEIANEINGRATREFLASRGLNLG